MLLSRDLIRDVEAEALSGKKVPPPLWPFLPIVENLKCAIFFLRQKAIVR